MVALADRREILDAAGIEAALDRVAREIAQRNKGAPLALIGIRRGGVHLARRLAKRIEAVSRGSASQPAHEPAPLVGVVDIGLYRDDVFRGSEKPQVGPTEIPFAVTDKVVVLVDDVLYTGRTVRAAIDAIIDFGRPRRIQLAALVDRGGRELPIQADFVGSTADARADETIEVRLTEAGAAQDRAVVQGMST